MKKVFFFTLAVTTLWACNSDTADQWDSLDLLPYGIPITILAPDSADVNMSKMGLMKDITVKKGNDFDIQIFASPVTADNIAELKASELEEVKSNRFFSKIINEEDKGFIYETVIDSNNINYGFRYLYFQADLEYVFEQSLIGTFSLDEVEKMYEAVKQGGEDNGQ